MKRALVTGSAGHLGTHLCRLLLDEGWSVRALDRAPHRYPDVRDHPDFEAIEGDVRDRPLLLDAGDGASVVFHCATQSWSGQEAESEILEIASAGRRHAAETAARAGARLVFTGSTAAVGETRDPDTPRDERHWNQHPRTPYQRAKVVSERELWEAEDGLDAVATLPAMFIGPDDPTNTASNARIEQMLQRARSPLWFSGGLNVVDVRDVARGHLLAAERGRAGKRYVLGGTNLTYREFLTEIRRLRGIDRAPWLRMPDPALVLAVGSVEAVFRALGKKPFLTARQMRSRLGSFAYVSSELARRELGYRPRPLRDTLVDLQRWFERRPRGHR